MLTSVSILPFVPPRRSPLRLQRRGRQNARHKQAIYLKSNDRFGLNRRKDTAFCLISQDFSPFFLLFAFSVHIPARERRYGRSRAGIWARSGGNMPAHPPVILPAERMDIGDGRAAYLPSVPEGASCCFCRVAGVFRHGFPVASRRWSGSVFHACPTGLGAVSFC